MSSIKPGPELAVAKAAGLYNIGEAAALSRVSAKMIRHYESIGLIPSPERSSAGYRLYRASEVHRLHFVKRSREFGFSMQQIHILLSLWDNRSRTSAKVKQLALAHSAELGEKIREMEMMRKSLEDLAHRCHGDDRPDCPILEDLAADLDFCAQPAIPRQGRSE